MTKPLSPEEKLQRHLERQQRRYDAFVQRVSAKPTIKADLLVIAQFAQTTPRAATIVSDWSPDQHGNPTRTIRARGE